MIVANVKQFRASFYAQLFDALAADGVALRVLYSAPSRTEASKSDSIELDEKLGRRIPRLYLAGERLLLQMPRLRELRESDLIVVVQASGYLLNYPLLLLNRLGLKAVAFWGHGYNHQSRRWSASEALKRSLAASPCWWFAYTESTSRYLESAGVDPAKITVINNAVDTRAFRAAVDAFSEAEINALRGDLGLGADARIALFCGSLYPDKRLDFLIDAARRIAAQVPEFCLLIVGAGPLSDVASRAADGGGYVRYLGPQFGSRKALCFKAAELFLNPGLTGLAILDSFAAGLPFITTDDAPHSPEIAYLEHGRNGLLVAGDATTYAAEVVRLLKDRPLLEEMRQAARETAPRYTVEQMVENVRAGIAACLRT
jgi:glycosyltransferase involved in cell wall biosynthesis